METGKPKLNVFKTGKKAVDNTAFPAKKSGFFENTEVGKTLKTSAKQLSQGVSRFKSYSQEGIIENKRNSQFSNTALGRLEESGANRIADFFENKVQKRAVRQQKRQIDINNLSQDLYINKKSFKDAIRDVDLKYIGLSAISQVPQIGLTTAGAVLSAPTFGGSLALSTAITGASVAGNEYDTLSQLTDDKASARRSATQSGIIQSFIEQIPFAKYAKFPGSKKIMGEITDDVISQASKSGLLKRLGRQSLEEGSTEALQQLVSNSFQKKYDENKDLFDGVLENFIAGTVLGPIFGSVAELGDFDIKDFKDVKTGGKIITQINDLVQKSAVEQETTGVIEPTTFENIAKAKQVLELYEQVNKVNVLQQESDNFITSINIIPAEISGKKMYQAEAILAPIDGDTLPPIRGEYFNTEQEAMDSIKELLPQEVIDTPKFQVKDDNLLQEAKKYKTAEEFVKGQGEPVYHGTGENFSQIMSKRQLRESGAEVKASNIGGDSPFVHLVENDYNLARGYARARMVNVGGTPKVLEYRVHGKILDLTNHPSEYTRQEKEILFRIGNELLEESGGRGADASIGGAFKMAGKERKSYMDINNMNISFGDIERSQIFDKKLKENGYSGIRLNDRGFAGEYKKTLAILPDQLKTKSQLEQIWNEANSPSFKIITSTRQEVDYKEVLPDLDRVLKRVGVETTVNIFKNIYTHGKTKSLTPEQAYGMYFDKEISIASRTTAFIHNHEISHLLFSNIDNIDVMKENGVTRETLLNELREKYGNKSIAYLDEKLAELSEEYAFNRYINKKNDTRGVIRKFLDSMYEIVQDLIGNRKNMSVMERYFDIAFGDKTYKVNNKVKLKGTGQSVKYSVKPTEYQQQVARFKVMGETFIDTQKDFLRKLINKKINKYSKVEEIGKDNKKTIKEDLNKLVDSIKSEAGIFNVLRELRQYEIQEKLKTDTKVDTIKKVTLLQQLKDLYDLNPKIIKSIKSELNITTSVSEMKINQLEAFLEEAEKRYRFATENGYIALPSKETKIIDIATESQKTKTTASKDLKSGTKQYLQVLQNRLDFSPEVRETFISADYETKGIIKKYFDGMSDYFNLIKDVSKHKITKDQKMVLLSKFSTSQNKDINIEALLHTAHVNFWNKDGNSYMNELFEIGDILGYDIRGAYNSTVKPLMHEMHAKATAMGLNINFVENPFPRALKPNVRNEDIIEIIKRTAEEEHRKKFSDLPKNVRLKYIGNHITSIKSQLASNGIKRIESSRELGEIRNSELLSKFQTPEKSMEAYISNFARAYTKKKFFSVNETDSKFDSVENEMNAVIDSMILNNNLTSQQLNEIRDTYQAFFYANETSETGRRAQTSIYVMAMGQITSMVTQMFEIIPAIYWTKGINGSPLSKKITPEMINSEVDTILKQEGFFGDGMSKVLLKHIAMGDSLGFTFTINTQAKNMLGDIKSYKKTGKENETIQYISQVYGYNAPLVVDKLSKVDYDNLNSTNTPYELLRLIYGKVSQIRVMGRLQKTAKAIESPGIYMLKNFAILGANNVQKHGIRPLVSGIKNRNAKDIARGLINIVSIMAVYGLSSYASGLVKDLALGRDRFDDEEGQQILASLFGIFGVQRYQIGLLGRKDLQNAVISTVTPAQISVPTSVLNNMYKTLLSMIEGENNPYVLKNVPLVGNIVYERVFKK